MWADVWEIVEAISGVIHIVGPIVGALTAALTFLWRQWRKFNDLKRKLEQAEARIEYLSDHQSAVDGLISDVEAAKAKIVEIVSRELANTNRPLIIDNFGLDLETVHLMFRYTFGTQFAGKMVDYRGLVIDPESQWIAATSGPPGNISQQIARHVIDGLNGQAEQLEQAMPHVSIAIKSYWFPPTIHGFIIGGDHLIMGITQFKGQGIGLAGGQSPYVYVRRDPRSPFKTDLFASFETWFNFWWTNGKPQVNIGLRKRSA